MREPNTALVSRTALDAIYISYAVLGLWLIIAGGSYLSGVAESSVGTTGDVLFLLVGTAAYIVGVYAYHFTPRRVEP